MSSNTLQNTVSALLVASALGGTAIAGPSTVEEVSKPIQGHQLVLSDVPNPPNYILVEPTSSNGHSDPPKPGDDLESKTGNSPNTAVGLEQKVDTQQPETRPAIPSSVNSGTGHSAQQSQGKSKPDIKTSIYVSGADENTLSSVFFRQSQPRKGLVTAASLSQTDEGHDALLGRRTFLGPHEVRTVFGYHDSLDWDGKLTEIEKGAVLQWAYRTYDMSAQIPELDLRLRAGVDVYRGESFGHGGSKSARETYYASIYKMLTDRFRLAGAVSFTNEDILRRGRLSQEDNLKAVIAAMYNLGGHHLLGGYMNNFGESESTKILGVAKPSSDSQGYNNLAYILLARLNESRRNHDSTAVLGIASYGASNQLVWQPVREIMAGWGKGTALDKKVADWRRLDEVNNPAASDLEDLGRIVISGFYLDQDLGSGMNLRAYYFEGGISILEVFRGKPGKDDPLLRFFVFGGYEEGRTSGIPTPFGDTEKESRYWARVGFKKGDGKITLGLSLTAGNRELYELMGGFRKDPFVSATVQYNFH